MTRRRFLAGVALALGAVLVAAALGRLSFARTIEIVRIAESAFHDVIKDQGADGGGDQWMNAGSRTPRLTENVRPIDCHLKHHG